MPDAQKLGSSSAPGICLANSGENSPNTVEIWTPTFSNTRPCIMDISPPPPGAPVWSLRSQASRTNLPGGPVGVRAFDLALELLEFGAKSVAQLAEPGRRILFLVVDVGGQGHCNA